MGRDKPVVVVVGAGFGGMNAARDLRDAPVDVILVDKNNYHLFQPLLYQVATAGLSATDIAYPVRTIFRKQENLAFRLAEMTGLDLENRKVLTLTTPIPYDYLILAPGGETNFFGIDSAEKNSIGLKTLQDSIAIRNHLLRMFELSTQTENPEVCKALRTFVIVGGGPTGVEAAGAISELIRLVLHKDYPGLDFQDVRVVILEMMDHLLPGFPKELSQEATEMLEKKSVEVRLEAKVDNYDGIEVELVDGETIPTFTMIWAAGVKAVSVLGETGLKQAKQSRVVVERTLQVPEHPEVFVIGDAAYLEDEEGKALPMVAPVAIQQAKVAAENIKRLVQGHILTEFEYKDPGSLATIGRNAAVARVKGINFHGLLAWVVWLVVHIFWLIGFRNRLLVLINWASDYFFYERAIRLITPPVEQHEATHPWTDEEQQALEEFFSK